MGICASCLGLNRRPSQDADLDRILDAHQPSYGALHDGPYAHAQPDEQELRREREALDRITAHAADQMIDIQHPSYAELHPQYYTANNHDSAATARESTPDETDDDQEAEEAAWLESVQAAGLEQVHLPEEPLSTPISVLRESSQAARADSGR